jgi:hypothetical protein
VTDVVEAPVPAKTLGAAPVDGDVYVTLGDGKKVSLTGRDTVPVGALVDARRGRVVITAAQDARGTVQTAEVTGGQFVVRQSGGRRPYTDLVMKGGDFSGCKTARRSSVKPVARAAAKRKAKSIRKLWASGHGRFRTQGSHAVATVRGTTWMVEDTCDGTLTKVTRGVVEVAPKKKKRGVKKTLVTAGKSRFVKR